MKSGDSKNDSLKLFKQFLENGNQTYCSAIEASALLLARSQEVELLETSDRAFGMFPVHAGLDSVGPMIFAQPANKIILPKHKNREEPPAIVGFVKEFLGFYEQLRFRGIVFLDQAPSPSLWDFKATDPSTTPTESTLRIATALLNHSPWLEAKVKQGEVCLVQALYIKPTGRIKVCDVKLDLGDSQPPSSDDDTDSPKGRRP